MPITHWNGSHHRILLFLTDGQILLLVLKLSCCKTQDDGTEMHGHKRAALGGKRNVRWEPVRKGGHQPVMHPQRIDFYLCMFGRNFYAMKRNTTWQIPWLSSSDILSKWPRFRHVKFLTRENWDITHFLNFWICVICHPEIDSEHIWACCSFPLSFPCLFLFMFILYLYSFPSVNLIEISPIVPFSIASGDTHDPNWANWVFLHRILSPEKDDKIRPVWSRCIPLCLPGNPLAANSR